MVSPSPRPAREPIFNLPSVVLASILVLVGIQLLRELVLSDIADLEFILDWAVVPARWALAYGGARPEDILAGVAGSSANGDPGFQLEVARYIVAEGAAKPWTAVTYAFLHGSWTHVVLNCVWLAAFGTPVARRCGTWRFLVLALASAVGGALALVRNGDRIRLSVKERRIDLLVDDKELQKRKSAWTSPGTAPVRGYAKLYMDHVLQAEHGCDFDFLRKA